MFKLKKLKGLIRNFRNVLEERLKSKKDTIKL